MYVTDQVMVPWFSFRLIVLINEKYREHLYSRHHEGGIKVMEYPD